MDVYRKAETQVDRFLDNYIEYTNIVMDRQYTDLQLLNRWIDRKINKKLDGEMDRWIFIYLWIDYRERWMNGDEWMSRKTDNIQRRIQLERQTENDLLLGTN